MPAWWNVCTGRMGTCTGWVGHALVGWDVHWLGGVYTGWVGCSALVGAMCTGALPVLIVMLEHICLVMLLSEKTSTSSSSLTRDQSQLLYSSFFTITVRGQFCFPL